MSAFNRSRLIEKMKEKHEMEKNDLENLETEEEKVAIRDELFKHVLFQSFEDPDAALTCVKISVNQLFLFKPWVGQRELIDEHIENLANSITDAPGPFGLFSAIIDENGNRRLIDGIQRQAALSVLRDSGREIEKQIRLDIYAVKSHTDEVCDKLFRRLNSNKPIQEIDSPDEICTGVSNYFASMFSSYFKGVNRPAIRINHFRKILNALNAGHLFTAREIIDKLERMNDILSTKSSRELKNIYGAHRGISENMIEKCRRGGFFLGLQDNYFIAEALKCQLHC